MNCGVEIQLCALVIVRAAICGRTGIRPFRNLPLLMWKPLIVEIDSPSLLWYFFTHPKKAVPHSYSRSCFDYIRDDAFCPESYNFCNKVDENIFAGFIFNIDKEDVWNGEPVIF